MEINVSARQRGWTDMPASSLSGKRRPGGRHARDGSGDTTPTGFGGVPMHIMRILTASIQADLIEENRAYKTVEWFSEGAWA